ncbi:hypothetical protein HCH_07003 [Hahella chejuensis KCTC 2396]|uniref:Uncharacterized protein n=1 Tax=Hahella chejuensis (strain KCTC 2396) TaxID=349521 RepID=Q2S6V6_HAHCH|nr:hypothetical protein HCH_07003 [Hahella chejuensis KCTC 2396]
MQVGRAGIFADKHTASSKTKSVLIPLQENVLRRFKRVSLLCAEDEAKQ